VLFLDIVEYSKRPVEEQIQLKQAFNRLLTAALDRVAPRDRIILDTGDGAAVTFPGDPEDALFTAISVRDLAGALPVRMGINLGPVRLVRDLNKQTSIIGDGINVAQRVMGFSAPGQLMVSRSFFEVVSCLSHDYANLFRHEGSRTDKHVRAHEVYSVVSDTPESRHLIDTASGARARGRRAAWWSIRGPLGLHHGALIAAPLVFFLIVGTALAIRTQRAPQAPPQARVEPAPPASVPPRPAAAPEAAARPATAAPAEAARTAKPARKTASARARAAASPSTQSPADAPAEAATATPAPAPKEDAPREQARAAAQRAAPREPALIHLAVAPWGEVFVDGKSRGVSPPLRRVEVLPGAHTVEIRNASFPVYVERIEVRSGDQVRIRHRFR
jgi:class 3 adenylate cyclase